MAIMIAVVVAILAIGGAIVYVRKARGGDGGGDGGDPFVTFENPMFGGGLDSPMYLPDASGGAQEEICYMDVGQSYGADMEAEIGGFDEEVAGSGSAGW